MATSDATMTLNRCQTVVDPLLRTSGDAQTTTQANGDQKLLMRCVLCGYVVKHACKPNCTVQQMYIYQ